MMVQVERAQWMPRKESTKEYIDRHRKQYKQLRTVYCPALKETVFFTAEGFNHLIFKKGHKRPSKQIRYRLPLIRLIIPTLKKCKSSSKITVQDEIHKGKSVTAMYFEISHVVGKKTPAKVKVIIKKRGKAGKLFFFSVMKQKTPKKGR